LPVWDVILSEEEQITRHLNLQKGWLYIKNLLVIYYKIEIK